MAVPGLRSALLSYVPNWLSNRPALNNGFKVLYTAALMLDIGLKAMVEGVRCWYPGLAVAPPGKGFVDPTTALPYAGRSRGLIQGQREPNATFAQRLIAWLQDWQNAGSGEILAYMIQAYLNNNGTLPMVRIIDRSGLWTTISPNGTITQVTAAWNWDGTTAPERSGWWSDIWIVIYPNTWPIIGSKLSSLVGVWGTYGGYGVGHQCDRQSISDILSIVSTWKGAHCFVSAIIWPYDPTLFVPNSPVSGDPDGTWAYWAKEVAGALVPSRTGASDGRVRYWEPPYGG